MRKLVIFDLDGTLLNTLGDIWRAVNYSLCKMGRQERTLDEIRSFIGNGTKTLLESALGEPYTVEDVRECFAHYSEYYTEHYADLTVPYDGIRECIDKLIKDGITCAVVTNKLHSVSCELCRKFFDGRFIEVIGDMPDTPRKPDPSKVLGVIERACADKAVYVGDSYVDVMTAINAKIPSIMLTWGFDSREHLVEVGAEHFADDAKELYNAINRIFVN